MINVQSEVITEYLTDSVNKEIVINGTHDGEMTLEDVNYYTGDITDDNPISFRRSGTFNWIQLYATYNTSDIEWGDNINFNYVGDYEYIVIAMDINFAVISGTFPTSGTWQIVYFDERGYENTLGLESADIDALTGNQKTHMVLKFKKPDGITGIKYINLVFPSTSASMVFDTRMEAVQVNFLNDPHYIPPYYPAPDFSNFNPSDYGLHSYTINNNNLIYEDFSLTESLCSKDNLRFGLCEAAHCEFSEVGVNVKAGDVLNISSVLPDSVSSITDDDIFAINWVGDTGSGMQTSSSDLAYWIIVMNTPYSPDWSDYIDKLGLADKRMYYQFKFKFVFNNLTGQKPTYFKFRYWTEIDGVTWWYTSNAFYTVSFYDDTFYTLSSYDPITRTEGTKNGILRFAIKFYDENKQEYAQGVNTGDILTYAREMQFRVGNPGHTVPAYSQDDLYPAKGTLDEYLAQFSNEIPLGVFKVASVSNEYKHNLIRKKVTAYDNLLTLEDNAADWYTRYMFGIDFDSWTSNGFRFARQIFSTYWDFVTSVGLDSDDRYTDAKIAEHDYIDLRDNYMTSEVVSWTSSSSARLMYGRVPITNVNPSKLYKVVVNNYDSFSPSDIPDMLTAFDELGRGATDNSDVLVEIVADSGTYGILCNSGGYFMLPDDCTSINIYLPVEWKRMYAGSWQINSIIHDIKVYESSEDKPDLVNGELRLCYYNYNTKDIFACESSITGRDVVRSLLEVCGCFFRLDRYKGLPEFVYPTKGGLYPSNTLYPADDLYPRAGTDQLYSMGKYISVIAENYEVKNYGRIQILKRIKSSDTQSVVEWQYEGDPDMENTYIIDDNIFYCAEEMEYDYDGMPEVAAMLAGMWGVISNLGYFPNVTQALGAPWLECGDRVGLLTYDGGFETFVFRRTLKGIQNLRDTYESEGDEITPAISNFGYTV